MVRATIVMRRGGFCAGTPRDAVGSGQDLVLASPEQCHWNVDGVEQMRVVGGVRLVQLPVLPVERSLTFGAEPWGWIGLEHSGPVAVSRAVA
jgi:hypothetical protein